MIPDNPLAAGLKKLYTIELSFRLISKNKHTRYLPKAYRDFEEAVAWVSLATCKAPLLKKAWVVIRPHFINQSHIDLNNCPKSLCDGMKKGKVFSDDKHIAVNVCPPVYGDERTEIEVWA